MMFHHFDNQVSLLSGKISLLQMSGMLYCIIMERLLSILVQSHWRCVHKWSRLHNGTDSFHRKFPASGARANQILRSETLEGSELFNRKVRRCLGTGVIESIIADSEFRNTYNIVGFVASTVGRFPSTTTSMANQTTPLASVKQLKIQLQNDFLREWDVLALDKASIRRFPEAE
jgi:hypothetical protein